MYTWNIVEHLTTSICARLLVNFLKINPRTDGYTKVQSRVAGVNMGILGPRGKRDASHHAPPGRSRRSNLSFRKSPKALSPIL
jgi:hypothetical protein